MSSSLDDLRAQFPHLGFCVYAIDPGGPVTLEIIGDGLTFSFEGPTLAACIARAFPPAPEPPPTPDLFA